MHEPQVTTMLGPLQMGSEVGGKYVVRGLLGKGSYAWVYWATHREIPSLRVAIKVLRSRHGEDDAAIARFRREADTAAVLSNPHIVRVIDSGTTDAGAPYIVMEFVAGEPLDELIRRNGRLKERLVAIVAMHICQAMVEAHARGIVHRDIKPANITLVRDDISRGVMVRVLDFGIAKIFDADLQAELGAEATATISVHCTPLYASPELLRGVVTPQADLYALGITMIEALDGRPPYQASTGFEAANQHLAPEPVPLGTFSSSSRLAPICRRATAKNPAERYPSANAMLGDLYEVFGEELGIGTLSMRLPSGDFDPVAASGGRGTSPESPVERQRPLRAAIERRVPEDELPPLRLDVEVGTESVSPGDFDRPPVTRPNAVASAQILPLDLEEADASFEFDTLAPPPVQRPGHRYGIIGIALVLMLLAALAWLARPGDSTAPEPAAADAPLQAPDELAAAAPAPPPPAAEAEEVAEPPMPSPAGSESAAAREAAALSVATALEDAARAEAAAAAEAERQQRRAARSERDRAGQPRGDRRSATPADEAGAPAAAADREPDPEPEQPAAPEPNPFGGIRPMGTL